MDKVTMKISKEVHKKLKLAKIHMDAKSFDEVLDELTSRYLEMLKSRGK